MSCQCGLIYSYLEGKQHFKLFPAVVRTDMAAVCKLAVAVSAMFLSLQQADAQ